MSEFWRDHFAGARAKMDIWSKAKRRGSRADLPYEYIPASNTDEFWLYSGDLAAEIIPGGFQFTHICEDGGTSGNRVMSARDWAVDLVAEFAGHSSAGEPAHYLDGTPGLPGEIRSLPDGREMIVWRSDSLEILEGVLFTYGTCYSEAIQAWLDDDLGVDCKFGPDGSMEIDLSQERKGTIEQ